MSNRPRYVSPNGRQGVPSSGTAVRTRSKSGVWRVVFWIALSVCVVSLAALGFIAWTYWSADQNYKSIASEAFDTAGPSQTTTLADMTVNWDYLRSINPDVVAWIYIPGTVVNYPVAHTDNNETYLETNFNGDTNPATRCGAIFLDASNSGTFSDTNNVLYGHHMNDGSMFACLSSQLTDNDEFNAHRTVYILTPTMNYKCTTFSLVLTNGWDMLVETNFKDAASRTAYIQNKEDRSVVVPAAGMPDPSTMSKLFTLSTCDYSETNGRAVLFAELTDSAAPQSATAQTTVSPDDATAVQNAAKEAA